MIELEVLTPKGLEYRGEAECLVLPTLSGEISILPSHIPLISVLKAGRMRIKTKGAEEVVKEIEGGILEVAENKMTILLKRF